MKKTLMPAKRITDAFVRTVKLPRKDDKPNQVAYIHTLERSLALVLVVSYGGSKTFRVLTYRNGKPRSKKLGTYPQMKLKEARAKARAYWENPQKFEAEAQTGSFKDIAEKWIRRHVEANKLISQGGIERLLMKYVYPSWGGSPFLEIRRSEVNDLLDDIVDNHGPAQADAVLAIIRGIANWYQSRDENYTSPIVRGMRRHKNRKARDRILDDDEIRAVWKEADGQFGDIIKLALLTA